MIPTAIPALQLATQTASMLSSTALSNLPEVMPEGGEGKPLHQSLYASPVQPKGTENKTFSSLLSASVEAPSPSKPSLDLTPTTAVATQKPTPKPAPTLRLRQEAEVRLEPNGTAATHTRLNAQDGIQLPKHGGVLPAQTPNPIRREEVSSSTNMPMPRLSPEPASNSGDRAMLETAPSRETERPLGFYPQEVVAPKPELRAYTPADDAPKPVIERAEIPASVPIAHGERTDAVPKPKRAETPALVPLVPLVRRDHIGAVATPKPETAETPAPLKSESKGAAIAVSKEDLLSPETKDAPASNLKIKRLELTKRAPQQKTDLEFERDGPPTLPSLKADVAVAADQDATPLPDSAQPKGEKNTPVVPGSAPNDLMEPDLWANKTRPKTIVQSQPNNVDAERSYDVNARAGASFQAPASIEGPARIEAPSQGEVPVRTEIPAKGEVPARAVTPTQGEVSTRAKEPAKTEAPAFASPVILPAKIRTPARQESRSDTGDLGAVATLDNELEMVATTTSPSSQSADDARSSKLLEQQTHQSAPILDVEANLRAPEVMPSGSSRPDLLQKGTVESEVRPNPKSPTIERSVPSSLDRQETPQQPKAPKGAAVNIESGSSNPLPSPTASSTPSVAPPASAAIINPQSPTSFASTPVTQSAPLQTVLDQAMEQVSEAREAGRSIRPELSVKHAEFGSVSMRIEGGAGDWKATLSARDPGFVQAVQAAISERSVTSTSEAGLSSGFMGQRSFDHSTNSNSQSNGQSQTSPQPGFGSGGGQSGLNYGSSTGSEQGRLQPYLGEEEEGSSDRAASEQADARMTAHQDAANRGVFA